MSTWSLRKRVRNFHRGRHSNLPLCCVLWFVTVRMSLPLRWLKWTAARTAWVPFESQYAPCPSCKVSGYRRPQHACTAACAGQRGSTYKGR